jgi:hypothetical protein
VLGGLPLILLEQVVLVRESNTAIGSTMRVNGFGSSPHIRLEYPLNLSILVGGGKETNKDFPSNGE